MTDFAIDVRDLRLQRGDFSLSIERWQVPRGSVVGLVGHNGAGKTTLLHLLVDRLTADSGTVRVLGRDPHEDRVEVRCRTGLAEPTDPLFPARISGVLSGLSGYYPSWDAELAERLLKRFDLDPTRFAGALSLGEGIRLRLVLAMAHRPELLLLDEPTLGLDLSNRRALLAEILDVVRDEDRTVVISSHRVEDLERVADRITLLHGGVIADDGAPEELVGPGRNLEDELLARGMIR